LQERGHFHQLPLQWGHLKGEALETLTQGKRFVLKAKENASLVLNSFSIFFCRGCFVLFCFVLFCFVLFCFVLFCFVLF